MNRLLLCSLMGLALSAPARASVLDELGQSLLDGPAPAYAIDPARERPISLQDVDSRLEPAALRDDVARSPQNRSQPGFFLMPVGRSDELGVGVGIRFPF